MKKVNAAFAVAFASALLLSACAMHLHSKRSYAVAETEQHVVTPGFGKQWKNVIWRCVAESETSSGVGFGPRKRLARGAAFKECGKKTTADDLCHITSCTYIQNESATK